MRVLKAACCTCVFSLQGIIQALCPSDWLSLPLSPWQLDALVHLGLPFDAQSQLKNGLQGSEQGSAAEAPVAPIMRLGGPSVVDGRLLGALRVVLAPAERAGAIQGCSVEDLCNWQRVTPYEVRVRGSCSASRDQAIPYRGASMRHNNVTLACELMRSI